MSRDPFEQPAVPSGFRRCIIWPHATMPNGYGRVQWEGRGWLAHRLVYTLVFGPVPPELMVCHRCDVRNCINPFHLFVGTHSDNVRDMYRKGRARNPQTIKTRCPKGHPYDERNTYRPRSGTHRRQCRACLAAYARRKRAVAKNAA